MIYDENTKKNLDCTYDPVNLIPFLLIVKTFKILLQSAIRGLICFFSGEFLERLPVLLRTPPPQTIILKLQYKRVYSFIRQPVSVLT